jgi:hypothetical protein
MLSGRSNHGEWGERDTWHAWERKVYRVSFWGESEWKRPLRRPRRIWQDAIRMDLREIGWGSVEWIHLAQDRGRWRALVNRLITCGLWRKGVSYQDRGSQTVACPPPPGGRCWSSGGGRKLFSWGTYLFWKNAGKTKQILREALCFVEIPYLSLN